MSLLTPSESHAFQNFLSSVEYQDHNHGQGSQKSQEWSMYSTGLEFHDQNHHNNDALAKATKDLMSLDADSWAHSSPAQIQQSTQTHYNYYPQQGDQQHGQRYPHHLQRQQPRRNVTFPFLAKKEQTPLHPLSHPQLLPISITPTPSHFSAEPHSATSVQSFSLPTPTSSTSSSSYSFRVPTPASPTSPTMPIRNSRSPKRTLEAAPMPAAKRQRPSPRHAESMPASYSRSHSSSVSPVLPSLPPAISSAKPPLLTASQKKANHIQSEQKRRANIRRGYEALCEAVPALKEAVRLEDEAIAAGKDAKSARGKRSKNRTKNEDSEKIDGRAGPRSENVVLMKTIDHINDLTSERSQLLSRLERARLSLPPNHPALLSSPNPPLWEREWRGGEAKEEDEDEEDEEL